MTWSFPWKNMILLKSISIGKDSQRPSKNNGLRELSPESVQAYRYPAHWVGTPFRKELYELLDLL